MKKNLYVPFLVSVTTYCASLVIAFVMNELDQNSDCQQYVNIEDQEYRSSISEDSVADSAATTSPALAPDNLQFSQAQKIVTLYTQQIASLFHSPASHFCLAAFFVKRVAFASESFVFQYASEKFLWPLRQTTGLRVATASGAIITTLIACPASFSVLQGKGFAAHNLDLNTVRISLLIVFISFFSTWKANSGPMLVLGKLQEVPQERYCLMLIKNYSNDWLWAW